MRERDERNIGVGAERRWKQVHSCAALLAQHVLNKSELPESAIHVLTGVVKVRKRAAYRKFRCNCVYAIEQSPVVGADIANDIERPEPGSKLRRCQSEGPRNAILGRPGRKTIQKRKGTPVQYLYRHPHGQSPSVPRFMVVYEFLTRSCKFFLIPDAPAAICISLGGLGPQESRVKMGTFVDLSQRMAEQSSYPELDGPKRSEGRRTERLIEVIQPEDVCQACFGTEFKPSIRANESPKRVPISAQPVVAHSF